MTKIHLLTAVLCFSLLMIVAGGYQIHRLSFRAGIASAQAAQAQAERDRIAARVDSISTIAAQRDSLLAAELATVYLVLADLQARKAEARLREMQSNNAIMAERDRFRGAMAEILSQ